jgi:glyoxylase-like metal-dependent hydrolase (beta-lactamase superfamily II)
MQILTHEHDDHVGGLAAVTSEFGAFPSLASRAIDVVCLSPDVRRRIARIQAQHPS